MNQMHGRYGIPNDDMRYVLQHVRRRCPMRWLDEYGYRPLSEAEKVASAHYYRRLGGLDEHQGPPGDVGRSSAS